ncbi:conserved hypothetical protein [Frankia canadensis]|uniref:Uncharacterized protein n=1 Tax=Frankia canadensis TaxID=1836972 RepID=A0A2I2KN08_9ACTN|nr:conserved hypothetical protein [Frankia canadensis]SOU54347.1 conserved hypothetical protein [Frankia canadensis]
MISDADRDALAAEVTVRVAAQIEAARIRADARRAHFTARRAARVHGNAARHRRKLARPVEPARRQAGRSPPAGVAGNRPQPHPRRDLP